MGRTGPSISVRFPGASAVMDAMEADLVGAVSRLWRYPVKSMLGEEVESADVV
jgi:hypothetical protein